MKDEEKQIEEIEKMAYSICSIGTVSEYITDCDKCGYYNDCLRLAFAQRFYNAGYRKQSDTVREVKGRLELAINSLYCKAKEDFNYNSGVVSMDGLSRMQAYETVNKTINELFKEYGIKEDL